MFYKSSTCCLGRSFAGERDSVLFRSCAGYIKLKLIQIVKQLRSYLIAVAAGVGLVFALPVLLAAIAALPGLSGVLRAMKAAHVPLQFYSVLVSYLPMVLFSFLVGVSLRRYVCGAGVGHLLVCGGIWVMYAAVFLIYLYSGTDVSWLGEIAGVAVVPLGLLLAAFVRPASSLHMSVDRTA